MSGENSSGAGTQRELPVMSGHVEVPSWRLLLTLGIAGAVAGLLIVFGYQATVGGEDGPEPNPETSAQFA